MHLLLGFWLRSQARSTACWSCCWVAGACLCTATTDTRKQLPHKHPPTDRRLLLCRCRYVLVRADTLQAPSDSLLRSARRQLGEPSDSKLPLGTDATDAAAGVEPASVARSRPLSVVAEEQQPEPEQPEVAADQQHVQEEQQQAQAQQAQQQAEAADAGQGGSAQPSAAALAAMARQLSKLVRWCAAVGGGAWAVH